MRRFRRPKTGLRFAILLSILIHIGILFVLDVDGYEQTSPPTLKVRVELLEESVKPQTPPPPKPQVQEPAKTTAQKEDPPEEPKILETPQIQEPPPIEIQFTSQERQEQLDYLRKIRRKILRYRGYPREAQKKGWEGTAEVNFLIGPEGEIREAKIVASSSHEALDKAAIEAILKASPYQKPPGHILASQVYFRLPIVFRLN